jgi:proteasome assembly chaperone 3
MDFTITPEAFPAKTKTASGTINGAQTEAMSVAFADKIVITISQGGKLAHWVSLLLRLVQPCLLTVMSP